MRKKSAKKAAKDFKKATSEIDTFLQSLAKSGTTKMHLTWAHDYAVIRLYREFEGMILQCLIAAVNNDTAHLSDQVGIAFPKHLTDEVCEYIIVGDGFFDFRGRDGLIGTLKKFLPSNHYLITIVRKQTYKTALMRLCALRNFAAHGSKQSRKNALEATGGSNMGSSGAWLKTSGRFDSMAANLVQLADEIEMQAPY